MTHLTVQQHRRIKRDYQMTLEYLRPIIEDSEHPVSLYKANGYKNQFGNDHEMLVCPCTFSYRPEWFKRTDGTRVRSHVSTGDEHSCEYKRAAMQVVKAELRKEHGARWAAMPLPEAVLDIWKMFKHGTYVGEHNVGMLYTQDLDELLSLSPRKVPYILQSPDGTEKETHAIDFPSDTINSAMDELKRRKLIDLSGCVLVPFEEHFCFPDDLHHDFAFLVGDQYGWPNGDAGDCFLWEVYKTLVKQTGWTCGEDVFGASNIPRLTDASLQRCRNVWIPSLDLRLADRQYLEKGKVLEEIPVEFWRGWLEFVQRDIHEQKLG